MSDTTLPILVAVDGSTGSNAAVRYAAVHAVATGRPLLLAHVPPIYIPAGFGLMGVPYLPAEFEAVGRELLSEASELAGAFLPADRITTRLLDGNRVSALNATSSEAYEIVLGADHTSALERYGSGSVVGGVAAGSSVPVIVVPDSWSTSTARSQRIVVGIKDRQAIDQSLLRAAFETASARNATVDFVHVWNLAKTYLAAAESLPEYSAWEWNADQQIRGAIGALADEFDDVRFSVTTVSGHPVEVLRRRCEGAMLLILARHPHRIQHFGHIGHTLLRSNSCPTEIIPLPSTAQADAAQSRRVAG